MAVLTGTDLLVKVGKVKVETGDETLRMVGDLRNGRKTQITLCPL